MKLFIYSLLLSLAEYTLAIYKYMEVRPSTLALARDDVAKLKAIVDRLGVQDVAAT